MSERSRALFVDAVAQYVHDFKRENPEASEEFLAGLQRGAADVSFSLYEMLASGRLNASVKSDKAEPRKA